MKIALLGIQGSGKSTQAHILSDRLGIPMVSVGGILRKGIEADDEFVTKWYTREDIDAGHLAPDELIKAVVEREMTKHESVIIEGFPRTLEQAQFMIDNIEMDHIVEVIISEECAVDRLTSRGRSDDHVEGIKNRLAAYYDQIFPIRQLFEEHGLYRVVNGETDIDGVADTLEIVVSCEKICA